MRIAVTGRNGQVVSSLLALSEGRDIEVIAIGRPQLDLRKPQTIEQALADVSPDIIVSAAAYTAVDEAESDHDSAFSINSEGAKNVARAANALRVPLIHLSTDYVYDGLKTHPYTETDITGPLSVYGKSKLAGDASVSNVTDNHVILRTSWVYSPFGSNFIKTMLRLAESRTKISVVSDQTGCPTSALDISEAIFAISEQLVKDPAPELRGTFHIAGQGTTSWSGLATAIFDILKEVRGTEVKVDDISTAQYPTAAIRPTNSCLSCDKLAHIYGIRLPPWRVSVEKTVRRLLEQHGEDL